MKSVQLSSEAIKTCVDATYNHKLWKDCARLLKESDEDSREKYFKHSLHKANHELLRWIIHYSLLPKALIEVELKIILEWVTEPTDCSRLIRAAIASEVIMLSPRNLHLIAMRLLDLPKACSIEQIASLLNSMESAYCKNATISGVIYQISKAKGLEEARRVAAGLGMGVFNQWVICKAIRQNDRDFLSLAMQEPDWTPNTCAMLSQSLDMEPPYTTFFDHPKLDRELARNIVMSKYVKSNELLSRFWPEAQEAPPKKACVASPDVPAASSSWEPSFQAAQSLPSQ